MISLSLNIRPPVNRVQLRNCMLAGLLALVFLEILITPNTALADPCVACQWIDPVVADPQPIHIDAQGLVGLMDFERTSSPIRYTKDLRDLSVAFDGKPKILREQIMLLAGDDEDKHAPPDPD